MVGLYVYSVLALSFQSPSLLDVIMIYFPYFITLHAVSSISVHQVSLVHHMLHLFSGAIEITLISLALCCRSIINPLPTDDAHNYVS